MRPPHNECFSVDEEFPGCTGVVTTAGADHCDPCIERVAETITDMATESALNAFHASEEPEE